MRVVVTRENGIVRRVQLLDDDGSELTLVCRFLRHLVDSGYSPNTVVAYAYDLRHLAMFLADTGTGIRDFRPSSALEFLGYLRRVPSRRPAQRLGPHSRNYRGPIAVGRYGAANPGGYVELLRVGDRRGGVQRGGEPDAEAGRRGAASGA